MVPAVITLESHALDFRQAYRDKNKLGKRCPLSFERCENLYENGTVDDSARDAVPEQFVDLDYIVLDSASISYIL